MYLLIYFFYFVNLLEAENIEWELTCIIHKFCYITA